MHDIISCQGYYFYSIPRKQAARRKSGSIGIFIRNEISEHVSLIESMSDYATWVRISKILSNLDQNIIIGVFYVPPQSSKYYNEDDFAQLEQEIMTYCSESEYVFLTGDFNAQTANMRDFTCSYTLLDKYLDFDQDTINNFDQEEFLIKSNITTNRASKDTKTNNTGFKLVDICKNNNLTILNGRYGQDNGIGDLTFRDKSVIDYSISSNKEFKILSDFKIEQLDRIYSDGHALLQMEFNINLTNLTKSNEHGTESQSDQTRNKTYKIDQEKLTQFSHNIDTAELQELKTYLDTIGQDLTKNDLNEMTDKISTLFEDSTENTFETIKPVTVSQTTSSHKNKHECKKH